MSARPSSTEVTGGRAAVLNALREVEQLLLNASRRDDPLLPRGLPLHARDHHRGRLVPQTAASS